MKRGFSLVELLIGMFIFTISMLGIVGVYPTAMRAIQKGRNIMMAQMLGEQAMQSMLDTPFASQTSQLNNPVTLHCTVNGVTQVKTFTVSTTVSTPANNLHDVVVSVVWADGAGLGGTVTYESESHN